MKTNEENMAINFFWNLDPASPSLLDDISFQILYMTIKPTNNTRPKSIYKIANALRESVRLCLEKLKYVMIEKIMDKKKMEYEKISLFKKFKNLFITLKKSLVHIKPQP